MADTSADPKANPLPLDPRLQAYLQDIMNLSVTRQEDQYPLHQAAMAMATRMAPGYAQNAMTMAPKRTDPNNTKSLTGGPLGDGSGSGGSATANAISALLSALSTGGAGGGNLIDLLKKLFGHGDTPDFVGNKPFAGGALNASPQSIMDLKRFMGFDENHPPRPSVTTSETFGLPSYNTTPNFMNGYPTDPSGGTGRGPGMTGYYGATDPRNE